MGSNPNALALAVSKGIITPKEAKRLVQFKVDEAPDDFVQGLLRRLKEVESKIQELESEDSVPREGRFVIPPIEDFKSMLEDIKV
jgi:hypothetical protein